MCFLSLLVAKESYDAISSPPCSSITPHFKAFSGPAAGVKLGVNLDWFFGQQSMHHSSALSYFPGLHLLLSLCVLSLSSSLAVFERMFR